MPALPAGRLCEYISHAVTPAIFCDRPAVGWAWWRGSVGWSWYASCAEHLNAALSETTA